MFARALQTKGIFACHCRIEADYIQAGILAIQSEVSGIIELLDRETGEKYTVDFSKVDLEQTYNVKIPRHAAFFNSAN